MRIALIFGVLVAVATSTMARAGVITSPAHFPPDATTIDFESFADGEPLPGAAGPVRFASESTLRIGSADITNAVDLPLRFDAPMYALPEQSGGGVPFGLRYAGGALVNGGLPVGDMLIVFETPVAQVGMWFIDNDFSTLRLRAFDASGLVVDQTTIPQVTEGGQTYRGFAGNHPRIAYLIIDGTSPFATVPTTIDSTYIDDLTYAVPSPASFAAALVGLLLTSRARRS